MPKPTFPPTPAPSTDIKGQDHHTFTDQQKLQQHAFELPPSAIGSRSNSASSREAAVRGSLPISPDPNANDDAAAAAAAAAAQRKRSYAQANAETSLPPPPSRSRKIIQVKPKDQQQTKRQSIDDADYEPGSKAGAVAGGAKKKATTTSAGRKIARKTAHSLIERRRRSKMNEEFGVLKDLIPACRGHEMHKLAILQASIDYLRYLEDCITELQSDGQHPRSAYSPQQRMDSDERNLEAQSSDDDEAEDEDEEMRDHADAQPPATSSSITHPVSGPGAPAPSSVPSPNFANFTQYRDQRHYSMASSEAPSPFLGAQKGSARDWHSARPQSQSSFPTSPTLYSTQTSPMLLPQAPGGSDVDREASAALLMLNASDRRTSISQPAKALAEVRQGNMKGISVKDLLSS